MWSHIRGVRWFSLPKGNMHRFCSTSSKRACPEIGCGPNLASRARWIFWIVLRGRLVRLATVLDVRLIKCLTAARVRHESVRKRYYHTERTSPALIPPCFSLATTSSVRRGHTSLLSSWAIQRTGKGFSRTPRGLV